MSRRVPLLEGLEWLPSRSDEGLAGARPRGGANRPVAMG